MFLNDFGFLTSFSLRSPHTHPLCSSTLFTEPNKPFKDTQKHIILSKLFPEWFVSQWEEISAPVVTWKSVPEKEHTEAQKALDVGQLCVDVYE